MGSAPKLYTYLVQTTDESAIETLKGYTHISYLKPTEVDLRIADDKFISVSFANLSEDKTYLSDQTQITWTQE